MESHYLSDQNMFQNVPYRDESQSAVREWLKKQQSSSFSSKDLRAYWKQIVPEVYAIQPNCDCLNITFDENFAREALFLPLETFLIGCETEADPRSVLKDIKTREHPSSLCGRVFKKGEPTYSCRDCGLDPTCVLCVECFKRSDHKNHRYKMSTSGGGGYCDCGDKEAWKDNTFCTNHSPVPDTMQDKEYNPVDKLPLHMPERINIVLQTILQYCLEVLTWENTLQLPDDLQIHEQSNTQNEFCFITMLYNDELHTYDQVIQSLTKAISCTPKEAKDFATIVDREGRSIIKCSKFPVCENIEMSIVRTTSRISGKPLKVVVMHANVVAHHIFSMRLLSWLQDILGYSEAFRRLFSDLILDNDSNGFGDDRQLSLSILEMIISKDTQLWKAARSQWHQLFIGGLLMDQHCKRQFSKVFTRNYRELMKDFIADDHDHSLSVTSLSVQIFTVPTVAHMLLSEEDAISKLMSTFLSECEHKKKASTGKLSFDKNESVSSFRRAQFILYDIKYLLVVTPSNWFGALRKNFLYGLNKVMILMSYMQGMDSVVRQVGQHMEYEPDWENGFNLHIRLAYVLTSMIEWCGSDRVVLIKAFRAAIKCLQSVEGNASMIVRELCDRSVSCIDYDVTSQPVSIHLPVSRFISGLFIHLQKYDLSYDSTDFLIANKPSVEYLLEFPLRTSVLIAQVHANMWRRNGYSLLNQIFFYQNVRCRSEMYDRDITMVQVTACLTDPDEFLIHVMNKFNLINWARKNFETAYLKIDDGSFRFTITLVEELLSLLITVVSERFTVGIGKVTELDRVKKEVIQLLCIKPMAHSSLSHDLPVDSNNETGLEEVIHQIADFEKPTESGKGEYKLKLEYYKDFDPFFYHYSKEEQSKAEESQRKRRKQAGEEDCCPPPVPPELTPAFSSLVNVLNCDVMFTVKNTVLERAANERSKSFSESQLHKILHLIGLGLHEEVRYHENNDPNYAYASKAVDQGLLSKLESLVGNPRVEAHKDLLCWVIKKFKAVQKLKDSSIDDTHMDMEFVQSSTDVIDAEKERRAKMAAERRAKIMAQMSAMQKKFMKGYAEMFAEAQNEESPSGSRSNLSELTLRDSRDAGHVALGLCSQMNTIATSPVTCILCQEDQDVTTDNHAMVLAAFIQQSTVLSQNRHKILENPDEHDPLLMSSDLFCAPHAKTCGHVMHAKCYQKFFDSVVAKERRPHLRFRQSSSFDINKHEFLCPLCECITNTVIPLVPPLSSLVSKAVNQSTNVTIISFEEWLCALQSTLQNKITVTNDGDDEILGKQVVTYKSPKLSVVTQRLPDNVAEYFHQIFSLYDQSVKPELSESIIDMINSYSQATYTIGLGVHPQVEDSRSSLMTWQCCAFTIRSMEWLLRYQNKPIFGSYSTRQVDRLRASVRFSWALNLVVSSEDTQNNCIRLLSWLLAQDDNYNKECQSIIDVDMFTVLVTLTFSVPTLFSNESTVPLPIGNVVDLYTLRLVYIAHVVQILLTSSFASDDSSMETENDDGGASAEELKALDWYKFVRKAAGIKNDVTNLPTARQVLHVIKQSSLPFLRCAAIFYHYLTDVTPKPELHRIDENNEHELLCEYLGLSPDLSQLTRSVKLQQLIQKWVKHEVVKNALSGASSSSFVQYPLKVTEFIDLPSDYSELINDVSLFTCPNSDGDDSRMPTMCLVCGKVLCSHSYCCQTELNNKTMIGACSHHALTCGAGNSIFLRIRDCKLLLLSGLIKGCFVMPPYLDKYGETDAGLKRGNPLHLSREKYKELHAMWLSHSIPETVSRAIEGSSNLLVIEWQNL